LETTLPHSRNALLRSELGVALRGATTANDSQAVDVIVTPNEMNERHGTGSLVRRLFGGRPGIVSIRARNDYGGEHELGDEAIVLPHGNSSRAAACERVIYAMRGRTVRRVVCVPYVADDLVTTIVLGDVFQAQVCIWIMDDQNVAVPNIPDALVREALEKARLRVTTHSEMREAYERKFGFRFALLPAVATGGLIRHTPMSLPVASPTPGRGAFVGSIWSRKWLEHLAATLANARMEVDWYGNHQSPYLGLTGEDHARLARSGIVAHGILPEPKLAAVLRQHSYALVPTGNFTGDDGNAAAVARLSLPGRILFIAATSNTPVIVLGSEETPASRFVRRFGIGVTSPYEAEAFRRAVEHVTVPEVQTEMRRRAAAIAGVLSSDGVADWLFRSLERGEPADDRFETLMPRGEGDMVAHIERPAPPDIYREYVAVYHAMQHLRSRGLRPDFVIDVGASVGIWSWTVSKVFPEARFLLVDPLAARYDARGREYFMRGIASADSADVAVSSASGVATLQVPPDLYGASLLHPADFRTYSPMEVAVRTVDDLAREYRLEGRGLLKADVQFAEHLVLEGARDLLPRLDAIVLELSLYRYHPDARTLLEMMNLLDGHGFRYFDDAGCWRSPVDGMLFQKDVLFVRRGVCEAPLSE